MANYAQLTRRQSSRELRLPSSSDRMELRDMHGRLMGRDGRSNAHTLHYGALMDKRRNVFDLFEIPNAADRKRFERRLSERFSVTSVREKGVGEKDGEPQSADATVTSVASKKSFKDKEDKDLEDVGDDSVFVVEGEEEGRESWDSKITFLLATIGYAVGLGNVWRFPYLCQKNGGGAFLIPYFIMLAIEGVPLFILELGIGQRLRKGSIGVWSQVSPYLAGIGIASCIVSSFVALYYNTIISWCLIYFVKSFSNPLPWSECPLIEHGNSSELVPDEECHISSPTSYFWYRETLNISPDINTPESFNWKICLSLIISWIVVFVCLAKGLMSSPKLVYVTALFPYCVLVLFFLRGITLEGMSDGIIHLFTPKWEKLADPVVWLDAGTQIFFSLGLAFGGLIAFSSYNPVNNHCVKDALVVSATNCLTSLFAGIVIYSVIGFKAHKSFNECLLEQDNATLSRLFNTTMMEYVPEVGSPITYRDPTSGHVVTVPMPDIRVCNLQTELDNTASGPGLAFIIFTEAIDQFSFSPFWSVLFFSMLATLGIDSQFGTLEGVLSSLVDMKLFPNLPKEFVTGIVCGSCLIISMVFAHGAGNYIFVLFDNFSGNIPLLIIAFCEVTALANVYGVKRFADDIELMTGTRPSVYWMICWKYLSPIAMSVILISSFIKIFLEGSTYPRWDKIEGVSHDTEWPWWALLLAFLLIMLSILWIPIVAIGRLTGLLPMKKEEPAWFPVEDLKVLHNLGTPTPSKLEKLVLGLRDDGSEGIYFRTKPYKPQESEETNPLNES